MIPVTSSTDPVAPLSSPDEIKWSGHLADDVGATDGPEPMATLVATADQLVLSGPRGTFIVPRLAVTRLGRGKMYPWFFSALRIHHSLPTLPKEIQFKPLPGSWREVHTRLKALGYP